jgi:hypothetical protein
MDKYILAGVGTATAFNQSTGAMIFNATTFTESSLNLTVTGEDIRGGLSNPVLGKYFHDAMLQATLTDALFSLPYVALNAGGDITVGGNTITDETITTTVANTITVSGTPVDFGGLGTIGWYTLQGQNDWKLITFTGGSATVSGLAQGTAVCVRYNSYNAADNMFTISSSIIPTEVHLVLKFPLFAAGSGAVESSSQVGFLEIDVPRFQFNGTYEMNLTATGAATNPLSGTALVSYTNTGCSDMGQYGTMTQHINSDNWTNNLETLAIAEADINVKVAGTSQIVVYGVYNNGSSVSTKPIDNANLTFTSQATGTASVSTAGVVTGVAAGTTTISVVVTSKTSVGAYADVTVTA